MVTTNIGSPFTVLAGEDRFKAPVRFLNGRFDCKVSGSDSGGAFCVFDTFRTGRGGPPMHFHLEQDEWFFVMDGEIQFHVGDETRLLKAGDSIFGPRRVPHAFACLSETSRMMIAYQPAGTMETFFAAGRLDPMSEAFRELSRRHGMEVVGPPLPL